MRELLSVKQRREWKHGEEEAIKMVSKQQFTYFIHIISVNICIYYVFKGRYRSVLEVFDIFFICDLKYSDYVTCFHSKECKLFYKTIFFIYVNYNTCNVNFM